MNRSLSHRCAVMLNSIHNTARTAYFQLLFPNYTRLKEGAATMTVVLLVLYHCIHLKVVHNIHIMEERKKEQKGQVRKQSQVSCKRQLLVRCVQCRKW